MTPPSLEARKKEFIEKSKNSKYVDDENYQSEFIEKLAQDLLTCINEIETACKYLESISLERFEECDPERQMYNGFIKALATIARGENGSK